MVRCNARLVSRTCCHPQPASGDHGGRSSVESAQAATTLKFAGVTNNWVVKRSASSRPYPALVDATTLSYSRPVNAAATDDGLLRTSCFSYNDYFDGYGNATYHRQECYHGEIELEVSESEQGPFTLNPAEWLIAHPVYRLVRSARHAAVTAQFETQEYSYQYDAQGHLKSTIRDPGGQNDQTVFTYDDFGNPEVIERRGPLQATRTTTIVYDQAKVFPTAVQNAEGFWTQVRVEPAFGSIESVVAPSGVSVQQGLDGFGRQSLSVGPEGSTTYSYAALPLTGVVSTAGSPGPFGEPPRIHPRLQVAVEQAGAAGSLGGRSEQLLDSYGRVVRTTTVGFAGENVVADRRFDARGRVIAESVPHTAATMSVPFTAYEYDFLDRLARVTLPDGSTTERQYGSSVHLASAYTKWLDNLPCVVDAKYCGVDVELVTAPHKAGEPIRQSVTIRDFDGLVVRTIDGNNVSQLNPQSSNFNYQAFGRLTTLTDNLGAVTQLKHDAYGRLETHVDPDSGTTSYTYTPFGEVATSVDAKGQLRKFSYDRLGRLISTLEGDSGTTSCPNYATPGCTIWNYDGYTSTGHDPNPSAIGQLSETISPPSVENPSGQQVLYAYEAPTAVSRRGLLKSVRYLIDAVPYDVGLHYDDLARPQQIDYPDRGGTPIKARYQYDPLSGALAGITEVGSNATRPIWNVQSAFQAQLPKAVQFGNGATSTFDYDPQRYDLNSVRTTLGGQTVQNLSYSRLATGQVRQFLNTHDSQVDWHFYQYDNVGRLNQVTKSIGGQPQTVDGYGIDGHGNIDSFIGKAITYPAATPHLPSTVGFTTYDHDANGNLEHRIGTDVPGGFQSFTYTPFDLPRTITTGSTTPRVTTFDYTADQTRVVRRDPDLTHHYVGSLYERKLSPAGDTLEEHFRLSADGSMVAEIIRTPAGDQTLFFHPDALGTPQTLTDAAGSVTHQDFTPFGARADGATSSLTRLGFTGHQQDDDLGLIDMGGRVYDPLAARFTTPDPILQAPFSSQGQNRYAYVFNDPVNLTDPSGFMADGAGAGVGAFTAEVIASSALKAGVQAGAQALGVFGGGTALTAGIGALGGGLNIGLTLFNPGLRGSDAQHYTVANPGAAAPTGSGAAPNGTHAVGQQVAPGPPLETNAGPAARCGTSGHPGCRTAAARARNLSATLRAIDELVKQWANSPSPTDPSRKETIRDSTMSPNPRHRVELTAGIIVDSKGVPRLTKTFVGDLDSSSVDWDSVKLRDGDVPIGTVHTHPGGSGGEHFSEGDIRFARDLREQLRSQGILPKTGVQIYVVQPANAGGILNYDVSRNSITPLW
jgi:RHS repeat-associated protein